MNTRKLTRSADKKIFGVAGGLAEYFQIDPTVMRLMLLVLALIDGSGTILISYLIAAIMVPKHDAVDPDEITWEKEPEPVVT